MMNQGQIEILQRIQRFMQGLGKQNLPTNYC